MPTITSLSGGAKTLTLSGTKATVPSSPSFYGLYNTIFRNHSYYTGTVFTSAGGTATIGNSIIFYVGVSSSDGGRAITSYTIQSNDLVYSNTVTNLSTIDKVILANLPSFSNLQRNKGYEFRLVSTNIIGNSAVVTNTTPINTPVYPVIVRECGEQIYTTPGTYSWICPGNVTSVSVVCVGGGGGGGELGGYAAGAGGGLAYKSNIAVTPGSSYTVVVGSGGTYRTTGGESYFINTSTCRATGGGGGSSASSPAGGTWTAGDGGGTGGVGGAYNASGYGGGGGAAGYTGTGGAGGNPVTGGGNGTGGGAGGTGGSNTSFGTARGGGVALYGQWGLGGAGGTYISGLGYSNYGYGGSGGGFGGGDGSGLYGGGGGCASTTPVTVGATGAVRIIWGVNRYFPGNLTPQLLTL